MLKIKDFISTEAPFDYPGAHPGASYLMKGEVVDVANDLGLEDAVKEFDNELAKAALPLIGERALLLCYGANRSPAKLYKKLSAYEDKSPDITTVPMLRRDLEGLDVVWHGAPGRRGSYFAELYKSSESSSTKVDLGIAALTAEQLLAIHKTEGATYDFVELDAVEIDGINKPLFGYVASNSSIAINSLGQPIGVAGITRYGDQFEQVTCRAMVERTLSHPKVEEYLGGRMTPQDYWAASEHMNTEQRKLREESVATLSQDFWHAFRFPLEHTQTKVGRAAFGNFLYVLETSTSTSKQYIQMLEQVGQRIRMNAEELVDPVVNSRQKAHNELSARLNQPKQGQ